MGDFMNDYMAGLIEAAHPGLIPIIFGAYLLLFIGRFVFIGVGPHFLLVKPSWGQRRTVIRKEEGAITFKRDVLPAFVVILLDSLVVSLFVGLGFLKLVVTKSIFAHTVTFLSFFVWTEIFFYYSHRVMHDKKYFWIHRQHHDRKATNTLTSLNFSIAERLVLLFGLVFIPGLVSQFVGISLKGMGLYFLLNYALNVYGHLNTEYAPTWFVRSWFGKIINTTTYHSLHHSRYQGHYGLFTSILDKVHGTYFRDYEVVHEQVSLGEQQ